MTTAQAFTPPVGVGCDPARWIQSPTSGLWHLLGEPFHPKVVMRTPGRSVVCGWKVQDPKPGQRCRRVERLGECCRLCAGAILRGATE